MYTRAFTIPIHIAALKLVILKCYCAFMPITITASGRSDVFYYYFITYCRLTLLYRNNTHSDLTKKRTKKTNNTRTSKKPMNYACK